MSFAKDFWNAMYEQINLGDECKALKKKVSKLVTMALNDAVRIDELVDERAELRKRDNAAKQVVKDLAIRHDVLEDNRDALSVELANAKAAVLESAGEIEDLKHRVEYFSSRLTFARDAQETAIIEADVVKAVTLTNERLEVLRDEAVNHARELEEDRDRAVMAHKEQLRNALAWEDQAEKAEALNDSYVEALCGADEEIANLKYQVAEVTKNMDRAVQKVKELRGDEKIKFNQPEAVRYYPNPMAQPDWDGPGWYWWDLGLTRMQGPFETEEKAYVSMHVCDKTVP